MTENVNNETIVSDAPKDELSEILDQVVRVGSNKELALISDNPDSSAEILLIRGDAGEPETYWFHVDGGVMTHPLKELICSVLKLDEQSLATDAGIYSYMATAAGIGACFQVNVPGVYLRDAYFSPLEFPLYQFVSETRGWNTHEVVYIKRSRNLAYKYRKAREAFAKKQNERDVAASTVAADTSTLKDEELLVSAEDIAQAFDLDDDTETLF